MFTTIPGTGYFIDYDSEDTSKHTHLFCGSHNVPGAWCPNCDSPLLRTLAIDVSDPCLGLGRSSFLTLPLFYCWTCNIAQDPPFQYRVEPSGGVELLRFGKGGVESGFPYPQYPAHFPERRASLVPVPAERDRALQWLLSGRPPGAHADDHSRFVDQAYNQDARHQLGGFPFLIQPAAELACPACKTSMPFLATIADDNTDDRGFTDNCGVQIVFHYCTTCHIVAAYNICD